jgi:hypothetical protein
MDRRTILKGTAFGGAAAAASAMMPAQAMAAESLPPDVAQALQRFRATIPANFDRTYVNNAVVPFFLTSIYDGERPTLPMLGVALTKENALPIDLWGLISEDWKPAPEKGVTVFLQGLEKRGPDNRRKRIYMSAVTPDLYAPMYQAKVQNFFDVLLDPQFADKPLMRRYLDYYWDLYWDLHLGVKGDAIPQEVREIGESFNTVLAYRDPTQQIVYKNYMNVRAKLSFLKSWIDDRLTDISTGKTPDAQKTIAWYWLKNAGDGEYFAKQDVVFECFHNFVALSQWGNTLSSIMERLSADGGHADVRASFEQTMAGDYDNAAGKPYTPLDLFVMELFRTISPNGGSISALTDTRTLPAADDYGDAESPFQRFGVPYQRGGYIVSPHTSTSFDPVQWADPQKFDPSRYLSVPTSAEVDEAKSKQIGFAKCPFDLTSFKVSDGRNAELANSAFGTVFGVADGKPLPVCDYAGFAPFGWGYRRCPGEQLTIDVFKDFLRKVAKDKITFHKLNLPNPGQVPVGPGTVIADDTGFARPA